MKSLRKFIYLLFISNVQYRPEKNIGKTLNFPLRIAHTEKYILHLNKCYFKYISEIYISINLL